jgi:hypothetical protein
MSRPGLEPGSLSMTGSWKGYSAKELASQILIRLFKTTTMRNILNFLLEVKAYFLGPEYTDYVFCLVANESTHSDTVKGD